MDMHSVEASTRENFHGKWGTNKCYNLERKVFDLGRSAEEIELCGNRSYSMDPISPFSELQKSVGQGLSLNSYPAILNNLLDSGKLKQLMTAVPSEKFERASKEWSPDSILSPNGSLIWEPSDSDIEAKLSPPRRLNGAVQRDSPGCFEDIRTESIIEPEKGMTFRVNGHDWVRRASQTETLTCDELSAKQQSESYIRWRDTTHDDGMLPSIVHVALEYSIPCLDYSVSIGGLHKVLDLFIRKFPLALCLIVPKLGDLPTHKLPPPRNEFYVTVRGKFIPVKVHILHELVEEKWRTFYLISSDTFEQRTSRTIYQCKNEAEEMALYSLWSQSVARVLSLYPADICHIHDYHACMAVVYLQRNISTKFCLTLHNGDFQGAWRIRSSDHLSFVLSTFNLSEETFEQYCEHAGTFNCLNAGLNYIRKFQSGQGIVAVSPLYGKRLASKHSMFWSLENIEGILNAVDDAEKPDIDSDNLNSWKRDAKGWVQTSYGLLNTCDEIGASTQEPSDEENQMSTPKTTDVRLAAFDEQGCGTDKECSLHLLENQRKSESQLLVFLGRQSYQKGTDIIADVVEEVLSTYPSAQIILLGPCTDEHGRKGLEMVAAAARRFPGRVHGEDRLVGAAERERLLRAADFALMPSRFEPCGLVDIEFGWRGALAVGFRQGGLGKMPGFYRPLLSSSQEHQRLQLLCAIHEALTADEETKDRLRREAVQTTFSGKDMFAKYTRLYMTLHQEIPRLEQEIPAAFPPQYAEWLSQVPCVRRRKLIEAQPPPLSESKIDELADEFSSALGSDLDCKPKRSCVQLHEAIFFLAYVLNFVPGVLVVLLSSSWWWREGRGFSFGIASSLIALYSLTYAISSLAWSMLALRLRPITLLRLGLAGQAVSVVWLGLTNRWTAHIVGAAVFSAISAALAPPVMIGLNFMEDIPGKVEVGHRIGVGEFLRNLLQAGAGAVLILTAGKAGLRLAAKNIIVFVFSGIFTLMAVTIAVRPLPPIYSLRLLPSKGQLGLLAYRQTVWIALLISLSQGATLGTVTFFIVWAYADGWTNKEVASVLTTIFTATALASLGVGHLLEKVRLHYPISAPLLSYILPPSTALVTLSWYLFGGFSKPCIVTIMVLASMPGVVRLFATNYILLQSLAREHFILTIGLRGLLGGLTTAVAPFLLWAAISIEGSGPNSEVRHLPPAPRLAQIFLQIALGFGGLEYILGLGFFYAYPRESLDMP